MCLLFCPDAGINLEYGKKTTRILQFTDRTIYAGLNWVCTPETKKENLRAVNPLFLSTEGGNRTRTRFRANRILSPACLPVPPLQHV